MVCVYKRAHDDTQPFVDGALLGVKKVSSLIGLHRGLASVMDF